MPVERARNLVFRAMRVQNSLYSRGSRRMMYVIERIWVLFTSVCELVAIVQWQSVIINNWIYASMPPLANQLFPSLLFSIKKRNCSTDPQVWKSTSIMGVLRKVSCVTRGRSFSVSTFRETERSPRSYTIYFFFIHRDCKNQPIHFTHKKE